MSRNRLARSSFVGACCVLLFLMAGTRAEADDLLVTTVADSGAGSLREAMTNHASGDRIVFEIPGTPTIILLSDLPIVAGDISFANNNPTPVTIDRNGNGSLNFEGALVNPTVLVIGTGGGASPDTDITTSVGTTVFGDGDVTGNLQIPGALAPGSSATPGTVGTLNVTGDIDVSGAELQLDLSASGGATSNDLINVAGTADVTGATLVPNFVGTDFSVGQTFLLLDSTNPIVGAFTNQTDAFQLPDNPFLEAIEDGGLTSDDFGFAIQDNGNLFTSVAVGCNQLSAATLLDQLQLSGSPPASLAPLRNGSTSEVLTAYDQLSGSIYPSLIGAEITHIQNNLESVRDRAVLQSDCQHNRLTWVPWIRGYGVSSEVDRDACQTLGYRHEIGGVEMGVRLHSGGALTAYTFGHLASGSLNARGVNQHADIQSYRLGGMAQYAGQNVYLVAAGGAGFQDYDVRRSLTAFVGSDFAESSFSGSSQFGYFELGANPSGPWTPYLAVHGTRVDLDPIIETGDDDFSLLNNGGAGESLRGVLGLSLEKSKPTSVGIATTRLRFGWMHEYLNASEVFVSQINNGGTPTGNLTDRGVDPGIDWAFLRVQVDMGVLLGGQFTVAYEGQYNSRSSFNAFLGGTQWLF